MELDEIAKQVESAEAVIGLVASNSVYGVFPVRHSYVLSHGMAITTPLASLVH